MYTVLTVHVAILNLKHSVLVIDLKYNVALLSKYGYFLNVISNLY